MEDANFEDLLLKDNSWNVHENNIYTLLIEIYKSMNNLNPPIMKDFFDLKNTRYDFRIKQMLKLPETSTSNMVPSKFEIHDSIEDFKKHIKDWKPTICSCKLCL